MQTLTVPEILTPVAPVKFVTNEQEAILDRAVGYIETTVNDFNMADWGCCLAHGIVMVCGRESDPRIGNNRADTHTVAREALGINNQSAERLFYTNFYSGRDWGVFNQVYDQAKDRAERVGALKLRVEQFKQTGL